MNKQDYIAKIKASSISDEKKNRIIAILEKNELDFNTKEEIKDILQEEIDTIASDIAGEDDSEISSETEAFSGDVAKIQAGLEEDMAYVEKEMDDLEGMAKDVDKAFEQSQIDTLKAQLTK